MGRRAIGVDIGGSRLKIVRIEAVGSEAPRVLDRSVVVLEAADLAPDRMVALIARTVAGAGEPDEPLGVGVAGGVRPGGVVAQAANLGWLDVELGARLRAATARRVVVENDANAHVYAEARAGVAAGVSSVLGAFLGTGLGGGLVLGGRLFRGERGLAGEIGHVPLVPDGEPCGCGARGCLEQYASSQFLMRRARVLGVDAAPARVGLALTELARAGDAAAQAVWDDLGRNLGIGIAGLLNVLDVSVVVVGGGVAAAYDLFGPTLESTARQRCFAAIAADVGFRVATLGGDAGAIGAACLAL